jgi:hypothetical protein
MSSLRRKYEEWMAVRTETISLLRSLADDVDWHYRNVRGAKIGGGALAVTGAALTIAGIVTAPLTFGALAIAGLAVGGSGAAISIGASATSVIIDIMKKRKHQKQYDYDMELLEEFQYACKEKLGSSFSLPTILDILSGIQGAGSGVLSAVKTGAQVAKVTLQGASEASIALNAVALPLNLADIVYQGYHIYKGTETAAGRSFRELADALEEQQNQISRNSYRYD